MNAPFEWELIERVTVAGPTGNGRKRHRSNPSVARQRDGTLLAAYKEGDDHWITPGSVERLCRSTDGGHTWSAPETIVAAEGRSFSGHLGMLELDNGTLVLPIAERHHIAIRPPYFRYYGRDLVSSHVALSHDGGRTWDLRQLDLGPHVVWTYNYGNVLIGRMGELIMCIAWHQEGDTAYIRTGLVRSWDGGQSWGHLTQIASGLDDEKSVCELPSGRWIAVIRDYDQPCQRSFSEDGGESWKPTVPLRFHGQSPSLLQTQSGVLLCAYRQRAPGKPQGVGLAYSYDEGETWAETNLLYVSPVRDCAYANLLELNPGEYIAVYYTGAVGTQHLVPQDDNEDPDTISPELLKFADADNAIELVRFRQRQ